MIQLGYWPTCSNPLPWVFLLKQILRNGRVKDYILRGWRELRELLEEGVEVKVWKSQMELQVGIGCADWECVEGLNWCWPRSFGVIKSLFRNTQEIISHLPLFFGLALLSPCFLYLLLWLGPSRARYCLCQKHKGPSVIYVGQIIPWKPSFSWPIRQYFPYFLTTSSS